jgi:sulfate adenylyltransferase subunit 2
MHPLSHLDRLEAESMHILREVAAEFRNPVMLYSIGKDSSVLLHLLLKAFAPARRRSRCCTSTPAGSSAK